MNSDTTQLVDVTVKVPEHRLSAFYEMHGRWLADDRPGAVSDRTDTDVLEGEPGGRLPWDPERDIELATDAWRRFPSRAKALFGTLIDSPDTKFTAKALAELHAIPNGRYGVAGVLAHPGRQLRKINRRLHFNAEPGSGEDGSSYWMNPTVAALFDTARRNAEELS